jgi:replicative DNA helicase
MNAPVEGFELEAIANIEAEHGLIGALLLDNDAFDRLGDRLRPNIRRYADMVIERHKSRALLAVSAELTELAQDHARTIEDRVEAAQGQLAKLLDDAPRDEWVSAYEGMVHHGQVLEDRAGGKIRAWPTGLPDLDDYLEGGLRPGEMVVVGARPSMGKTALAMTIGLHMAGDYTVAMLSMEMPHNEVRDRMTAMLGNVSLSSVKRPNKGNGLEWDRVVDGTERAKHLNFYVSDHGGLNINQVRSKARNIKRLHGLNVLMIDYIGLMSGLDAKQPRVYQLEEISRGLKTLAKELDIAILCLAQVNRKVEERIDHTPNLSDLRDSGAIEQDADVVIFVHRPIQAKPDLGIEWAHYAKANIAKNRQGRCGIISLSYIGDQTRFSGWAGEPPIKHGSLSKGGSL